MRSSSSNMTAYLFFCLFFTLNTLFWWSAREIRPVWVNVPPVPSDNTALSFSLGDKQLAYRSYAFMLQNLGESGGRSQKLVDYNYDRLGEWFFLEDRLDPVSNFVPLLAAFYYSATPDNKDLDPIINYLADIGQGRKDGKWRWLAQAIYLARFRQNDLDKSLQLSYELASHPDKDRPAWTYQMPAFVLNNMGKKEAAHDLLMNILIDRADELDPAEVNFTKDYICNRILNAAERENHPLCNSMQEKNTIE